MLQAVGGLTKVAIQRVVGAGTNLACTEEMFSLLKAKFCGKSNPMYIFKGISSEHLDEERKMENLKKYSSSKGSLKFQITELHKKMKFSTKLCICKDCQQHWFL